MTDAGAATSEEDGGGVDLVVPVLQVEMRRTDELVPYLRNARVHSDHQIGQIATSIAEFGFVNPILIGDDDVIVAGHGRLAAAQRLGLEEVPVIVLAHLSSTQRRALVIADNQIPMGARWDEEALARELAVLKAEEFDLDVLAFDDGDVEALLDGLEDGLFDRGGSALGQGGSGGEEGGPGEGQGGGGGPGGSSQPVEGEDEVPEPPAEPVSRPGDLWQLGEHRLICGDSTKAVDVKALLGTAIPMLMVTDPPYGVEYDPNWRNEVGAATTKRTGKVLNDDRADWREAWALFPGDVAYVWHGALHTHTVAASLEAVGLKLRSQIIWGKERLVLSRGDYHWQHEPCWYAVKKTGKGHWAGDRKQTSLWLISAKDQDADTIHGTQKPVECMRRPMLNNSLPGQAVYEPFMGSGTTLIAAETCGRVCFGVELNPIYVDVAVERWQNLTGKKAVLHGTGQTFEAVREERLPSAA